MRRRERLEREIEEEFAFHLDLAAAEGRRSGLDEAEADARARSAFGSVDRYRAACVRAQEGWLGMISKRLPKAAVLGGLLIAAFVAGLLAAGPLEDVVDQVSGPRWARVGAFSGFEWSGDDAFVLHDGAWRRLEAINGRPVAELLDKAAVRFGEHSAKKRVREDLYEVLQALGERTDAIDARLVNPGTDAVVELTSLPLDAEKRDYAHGRVWRKDGAVPAPPA